MSWRKLTANCTAEELRAIAAKAEVARQESFERCDTDGFLSQAAGQLAASVYRLQADIIESGGQLWFTGLFTLDGKRVRAKIIRTKYGLVWAFCDAADNLTGKFISVIISEKTLAKKGFKEEQELAPCVADSKEWAAYARRTDKGYPDNAIIP